MKNLLVLILVALSLLSCNHKEASDKGKTNSPEEILQLSQKKHGNDGYTKNNIQFYIETTRFQHKIENYRPKLTQTRITDDGTVHKATYYGGLIQYYINDSLQSEDRYPVQMLERSLYGLIYTSTLPLSLKGNDLKLELLQNVIIRQKEYITLKVTNKDLQNDDVFILYLDKNNFELDYVALKHSLTSNYPQFRRFINQRPINGILFQDYIIFAPKTPELPLEEFYIQYNEASLKEIRTIKLDSIKVY